MSVEREAEAIERTIDDTLDVAQRHQARQTAQSRLTVYRKALREVQRVAGDDAMQVLSRWVQEEIRENHTPPTGRAVRQRGAKICRENGEEVSTGSWLGA